MLGQTLPPLVGLALLAAACGRSAETSTTPLAPPTTAAPAADQQQTTEGPTTTAAPIDTAPPTTSLQLQIIGRERNQLTADGDLSPEAIEVIAPYIDVLVTIPQLEGLPDETIQERINGELANHVETLETGFVVDQADYLDLLAEQGVDPAAQPPSFIAITYDVRTLNPRVLSIRFDETFYSSGAANPLAAVDTFNFDLTTGRPLELSDVFGGSEFGFALDALARQHIIDELYDGDVEALAAWVSDDELLISPHWALGPAAFEMSFEELEIGPGVFGAPTISIPYQEIGVYVNPEGPIGSWGE